jgi:aminopeptidase-like protein
MYDLITELYPICRSMTGDGVRRTLEIIGRANPLQVHEVPSGTSVFDWTVPKEWNIRDAFIKDSRGKKIVDWAHSNLHVVGYSVPVRRVMRAARLDPVQDVVLQGGLGFLPQPRAADGAGGGQLRGLHRFEPS